MAGRALVVTGAVALAMLVGVLDPGVAEAGPGPDQAVDVARARERLRDARQRAQQATVEYQAALDEEARLEAQFEKTARKVGRVEVRVRRTKRRLEVRAVARYRGEGGNNVLEVIDTEGPLEARRLARVIGDLADRDERLLDRYLSESEAFDALLDAQRATRDAQHVVVEQLDATQKRLESELRIATQAYRTVGSQMPPEPNVIVESDTVCPIQAPVTFTNDWHAPRSGGRLHEGNDIFADPGSPNVAVVDGELTHSSGGLGGNGVYLVGDDGNSYYYAHFSAWEGPPRRVVRGEVVGYTGNTGNAAGGAHHTHFEIHPGGGEPVNPYPTLSNICAKERGQADNVG